jgi:HD domain
MSWSSEREVERLKHAVVGSWPWAQRTGGTLSRADRRALMNQVAQAQWHRLVGRITRSLGSKPALLSVEALRIPDSPAAVRAAELCAQLSPLWLQHHCTRTYVWGSLFALRYSRPYDEELLYVAAMLHDLGLTPAYTGKDATARCFAVEGARAAITFAQETGWDAQRQDALAEAISLHLNVTVGLEHGIEAHLLHAGASCDVLGQGYQSIAPSARSLVLERCPRLDFKQELDGCMRQQVALRPEARVALYYRAIQFGERIARAPFAE